MDYIKIMLFFKTKVYYLDFANALDKYFSMQFRYLFVI